MLRCLNGLRHVALDILTAPWRKKITFLDFQDLTRKSMADKIQYQQYTQAKFNLLPSFCFSFLVINQATTAVSTGLSKGTIVSN